MSFHAVQSNNISNFLSPSESEMNIKYVEQCNELQRMERLLKTKQSSLESLLISNNSVRTRCKRLDKKLIEYKQSNQELIQRAELLEKELDSLKKHNADIMHSNKVLQITVTSQRSQLKYARSVSQKKQIEIEYRKKVNQEILDENSELNRKLASAQGELKTIKSKWMRLYQQKKSQNSISIDIRYLLWLPGLIVSMLKKVNTKNKPVHFKFLQAIVKASSKGSNDNPQRRDKLIPMAPVCPDQENNGMFAELIFMVSKAVKRYSACVTRA